MPGITPTGSIPTLPPIPPVCPYLHSRYIRGYFQGVPVLGEGLYSKKIHTPTTWYPCTPLPEPLPACIPLRRLTGGVPAREGGIPRRCC